MGRFIWRSAIVALMLPTSAMAQAVTVTLSGTIVNSCTLPVTTGGTLALSANGQVLGSENSGGVAATMTVLAVGNVPTVAFAAPSMTASPSGFSGSPTVEIKYAATSGASQAYTGSATSVTAARIDTFTVNGRLTNSAGYNAGTYTMATVATCQQN